MNPVRRSRSASWRADAAILTSVVLLMGACSSASGPAVTDLTPWSPPEGQRCTPTGPTHTVAELLDTTALAGRISEASPADGDNLASVRAGHGDRPLRLHPVETTLPPHDAEVVEAAIRATARSWDTEKDRPGGRLHVGVAGGTATTVALGPTQACTPDIINERELAAHLEDLAKAERRSGTANVWIFVGTSGTADSVRINRSTGRPTLDLAMARIARRARFHPALLDRRRVAVWVAIDLSIRCDRPRRTPQERRTTRVRHLFAECG
jgi:TonB family protein